MTVFRQTKLVWNKRHKSLTCKDDKIARKANKMLAWNGWDQTIFANKPYGGAAQMLPGASCQSFSVEGYVKTFLSSTAESDRVDLTALIQKMITAAEEAYQYCNTSRRIFVNGRYLRFYCFKNVSDDMCCFAQGFEVADQWGKTLRTEHLTGAHCSRRGWSIVLSDYTAAEISNILMTTHTCEFCNGLLLKENACEDCNEKHNPRCSICHEARGKCIIAECGHSIHPVCLATIKPQQKVKACWCCDKKFTKKCMWM